MSRVIDLGAGTNPDHRSTETVDINAAADHDFDLGQRWELETESVDGLVMNHVIEHLDADHVFSEAARVLKDDGWFEISVPLGYNQRADLDHATYWNYKTPEVYSRPHQEANARHWDPDSEFKLVDRELDVWLSGPLGPFDPFFQLAARRWPDWAAERCFCGELTAHYRRLERGNR